MIQKEKILTPEARCYIVGCEVEERGQEIEGMYRELWGLEKAMKHFPVYPLEDGPVGKLFSAQ